ncbi:MAG: hypothetical protein C0397_02530 [Odoribacter sp.]|nr:hypothetical protein [Odoribacter sp.]
MKNFTETIEQTLSVYPFLEAGIFHTEMNEFRNYLADFKFDYERFSVLDTISDIDSFLNRSPAKLEFAVEIQNRLSCANFSKLFEHLYKLTIGSTN